MDLIERFLSYVAIDTCSKEDSPTCPSTEHQFELGKKLEKELSDLGAKNAHVDEHCYVYAEIPANTEGQPVIGLIAHMDTVDCVPVLPMRPKIVEYQGGVIPLDNGECIDPAVFPDVKTAVGKHLIVTDGNTLLGADDKAGVAEILTACETLIAHPEIAHGRIVIGFTPDEEIGRGADRFDVAGFGADYAYTVDGGALGEMEYECFNAASCLVKLHGVNIHPGSAKNQMKNASLLAMEFASMLPAWERPEHTEGYEGFYHLAGMRGDEEEAELRYSGMNALPMFAAAWLSG